MARKRGTRRQEHVERNRQLTSELEDAVVSPEIFLHLFENATERQRRLFANACCRRVIHLCGSEFAVRALEISGVLAEGIESDWAFDKVDVIERADVPVSMLGRKLMSPDHVQEIARWTRYVVNQNLGLRSDETNPQEEQAQTTLLRDILENSFRPVHLAPAWRTETAVLLARQMYESHNFGAMPILADALQDAGCDQDDILNHCRDINQVHVRGCWVVDLVLGKC